MGFAKRRQTQDETGCARSSQAILLGLVLSIASGARPAWAMGEADRVDLALLSMSASTPALDSDAASAIERLAWELEKRTSVAVAPRALTVSPTDPALRRHPLLVLRGRGPMPPPEERALDALRAHLEAGGLLFIDEATLRAPAATEEDPFDRDVRTLSRRLFPRAPLSRLGPEHVLYKTFYLLRVPLGRHAALPYLEAVLLDGRIAILYARNDVLGALARDRLEAFAHAVEPGGEPQREYALRLAINIVMYALCLDYKADQVHVPFLLKRRRPGAP